MADLVANRAEMKSTVKIFQSYGNDSMAYSRVHFEKNKREECCELQGGRLNFYESAEPDHNTTTRVMEVEKRRGTNILILRCGPGSRVVIFMEFDSKRITDEWQEALCRYTGQTHVPNPALPRVRSELLLPAVERRRRDKKTRSTFPDIFVKQVDSDSEQKAPVEAPQEAPEAPQQAPFEAPLEAPQAPQAPQEALHNVDDRQHFADLCKNSVEEEFNISDLQHAIFEDVNGRVIVSEVTKPNHRCHLHVGDTVLLRNARGFLMNARELTEHIRTSIVLTIKRGGLVCTAREEGGKVTITFKESQTVRLDIVDLIRRACTSPCHLHDAEKPEIRPKLSNLTITEINGIPVPIGSQAHQIYEIMRDALETSGRNLTLHVVPQSLLDRLDDDTLS